MRPLNGLIHVSVFEHQKRALAASLKRDVLHVDGCRLHDVAASHGAARESDLVNLGVTGKDSTSGLAVAGDYIDNARREASLLYETGQVEG